MEASSTEGGTVVVEVAVAGLADSAVTEAGEVAVAGGAMALTESAAAAHRLFEMTTVMGGIGGARIEQTEGMTWVPVMGGTAGLIPTGAAAVSAGIMPQEDKLPCG